LNDRQKGILALIIVFLALLVIGILEAYLTAATPEAPLPKSITGEVDRALKYRDGVILWWDRKTGAKKIYGNRKLMKQNFLPGSLMKLITAEAATTQGMNPAYHCEGHDTIDGKRHNCWTPKGHGRLNLPRALSHSCNLYFSNLGRSLGFDPLLKTLRQYPLGQGRDFKKEDLDLMAFSVGDEANFQVSPEQMARFWDQYLGKLQDPRFQGVRQGLLRAATEGTAKAAGNGKVEILAKTGTADSQVEAFKTHGWFLGAYPAENPRWALLIFMKNAHGYLEPSRLAGKIFERVQTP